MNREPWSSIPWASSLGGFDTDEAGEAAQAGQKLGTMSVLWGEFGGELSQTENGTDSAALRALLLRNCQRGAWGLRESPALTVRRVCCTTADACGLLQDVVHAESHKRSEQAQRQAEDEWARGRALKREIVERHYSFCVVVCSRAASFLQEVLRRWSRHPEILMVILEFRGQISARSQQGSLVVSHSVSWGISS